MTSTPIVQFGTSRFLQAHADLMIGEALEEGAAAGPITVVQSSGDPARARRLDALAGPAGYPVIIRGLRGGERIDRRQQVRSVARTLSTASDWERLVTVFCEEAQYVLSNTGDSGYAPRPADGQEQFDQDMSFPAKLQLLLWARYNEGARPLTVMPLELVRRNGEVLKARIRELARGKPNGYRTWLEDTVIWANSLVDRIVSEPIEPAGAVAEPYALWAIEAAPGLVPPCRHPDVEVVDNLETIEARKLFILNLGHTYLVSVWQRRGQTPATVAGLLDDDAVRADLLDLYEAEVLPAFAAAGPSDEAKAYVETTVERFRNPFLDHALADIAQNHAAKVDRRIAGFISWARERGDTTDKERLATIVAAQRQPHT